MTRRHWCLFAGLVFVSLEAGGCLPRGEPPTGRQLLADPTAALLTVTPVHADGTRQVMFFRPSQEHDPDLVDLWSLTLDASGQPSAEKLLSSDIAQGLELSYRPGGGGFRTDASGGIFLPDNDSGQVVRYDPVTGAKRNFGTDLFPALSPSGRRVISSVGAGSYSLYEADGSTTTFEGAMVTFVGETVYFLSGDCALMRIVEGGSPELFVAGVQMFQSSWGALLILQHTTAVSCFTGGLLGQLSHPVLLDTATKQETVLPDGLQYDFNNFSPDGSRLTARRYDQNDQAEWFIYDRTTGGLESVGHEVSFANWRPGHDELWLTSFDDSRPGLEGASLTVWIPGRGASQTVPGVYAEGFSADGRNWFSRGTPPDRLISSDLVGVADQPSGPRYHAVPEGSSLTDANPLGDGRVFVGSYTDPNDFRHTDYLIVDPRNGATDVLGLRGFVAATGNDRLLGIFNYNYERGDLTSVDLATGKRTILVSQFVMEAIADAQGADPYPPSTQVFYQFRARLESPWSGLWVTTVP